MPAREAAAEGLIERGHAGGGHVARRAAPGGRLGERDIELARAQQRFEFSAKSGGHEFRFLFASCGEYSPPAHRDQEAHGVSV